MLVRRRPAGTPPVSAPSTMPSAVPPARPAAPRRPPRCRVRHRRRGAWRPLALLLGCLWGIAASQAGTPSQPMTPEQWLQRMLEASGSLSYEGTFVYFQSQGRAVEAMQVVRDGLSGQQRMMSLSGPLRELIVKDGRVICLLPEQQKPLPTAGRNRSLFPISFPNDVEPLLAYYRLDLLDEDRVANRRTQVVVLQPRDRYRFGYRLWLDHDTGMLLRSALVDVDGGFLEQLIFTEIAFPDRIDPQRLKTRLRLRGAAPAQTPPAVGEPDDGDEGPAWEAGTVPPGFERLLSQRYPSPTARQSTRHWVFGDGLATVSVFIEHLPDGQAPLLDGGSSMGAMNAYGRIVDGYQVLVVGEVPALTVRELAEAIARRPSDGG